MNFLYNIYQTFVIFPLERFYLKALSVENGIFSIGGWQGKSHEEICFQLTKVPIYVWIKQEEECNLLIQKNFQGTLVWLETLLYFYLLFKTMQMLFTFMLQKIESFS